MRTSNDPFAIEIFLEFQILSLQDWNYLVLNSLENVIETTRVSSVLEEGVFHPPFLPLWAPSTGIHTPALQDAETMEQLQMNVSLLGR